VACRDRMSEHCLLFASWSHLLDGDHDEAQPGSRMAIATVISLLSVGSGLGMSAMLTSAERHDRGRLSIASVVRRVGM